jgi:hypothetical protein
MLRDPNAFVPRPPALYGGAVASWSADGSLRDHNPALKLDLNGRTIQLLGVLAAPRLGS